MPQTPTWLSARSDDGTPLRLARWGEDHPRDVLIVHGLAEHAERYGHVAEALVAAGWRVTLVELRGHGESGGQRGHTRYWHRYVEDVQAAAEVVGRPFALVAHSMGGLVVLDALREPLTPACKAVALTNPQLGLAFVPPAWKVHLGRVLTHLLPILPIPSELDTTAICRDPEVVRAYEADPKVFSTVTARWFSEMSAASDRVNGAAGTYTLPLRMMVGTGDQICSPQAAQDFADRYGGDATKAIYEGFYHELFNEPEKDHVLAELVAWLDEVWAD